ncbi:CoA-acylating methylmalonate-semialdehyde dehydrogenase [Streptosporangium sp. KLBMP 9127]|nr:CoA-acylating methylmalonate-semialdehyde dehydrogenase [Streptosporangium sp. KLBMP 9127]
MRTIGHWIGGRPSTGSATRHAPVFDPATGAEQARVVLGEAADVDLAVRAAAKAFESWGTASLTSRTRVMFRFRDLVERHLDELAELVAAEHGKVVDDARGEVVRGMEVAEYACGLAELLKGEYSQQASTGVDVFSVREPLGVCAGVSPFNFPVMVPMWMHPVAIACGNTFVLKPSERDPSASIRIAELYAEAGLPEGVFNVVQGDRVTVDALLDHPGVAAVSFVGSTPVARHVHERAGRSGKRVQALGGAKNHAVVLPDADLDFAADQIAGAAYGSAGQRCMAISAVVAVGDAAGPLVERLAERARAIKVGPGRDPGSEMGPVVTHASRERITAIIEGADGVLVDGRDVAVPGHPDGFFVGPTLVDGVTPGMEVYTEEVFGPVLAVLRAETLDDAIEVINANPYGNGTAIFTNSGEAAQTFRRRVHVGMIGVNVPIPVPMAYHSFGGWKDSLFGDTHVHGPEGVRFYTRAKVTTTRWPRSTPAGHTSLSFPTSA